MAKTENESEISKKTILVLLVLTIMISAFGTLTLINAIEMRAGASQQPTATSQAYAGSGTAVARVNIIPPAEGKSQVVISIAGPEGN
jgi:hypothetical protein